MENQSYGDTSSTEDVREKASETASNIVTQAQEVASTQASSQMTRAASALDSVAITLRDGGSNMSQEQPQVAQIATQAADRVEQVSNYLRDKDLRDVVRDAEDYARREPLIFLGGALALGFLAARFLKASSPQTRALQPAGMYTGGRESTYGNETSYGDEYWNTPAPVTRPLSAAYTSDDYAEPAGSQLGS